MSTRPHTASLNAARTPVIIGVGEITWRPQDLAAGLEPLSLMAASLHAAQADALEHAQPHVGAALLQAVDSLDVVCEHSWPYEDAPALLSERMHMAPRHRAYAQAGGESPVRLLHEAAMRIAEGESAIAAIVGAESSHTVASAAKAGTPLNWTPRDQHASLLKGADICHPIAVAHGMVSPVQVYAFFENALTAAAAQTPEQAQMESGTMWSHLSEVAEGNPYAWQRRRLAAQDIITPHERNRLITWPYTLSMVANPLVNMGAAIILTNLQLAHELGIPDDKLVYVLGGAQAQEPRDYLARANYWHVPAQEAVLEAAKDIAGGGSQPFQHMELYSCFPVVPKLARRVLGLPADASLSVTGGLSYFGGPLNNYMSHGTAAMVRALRAHPSDKGLLYGQGEYLTKHHAVVLSTAPSPHGQLQSDGGAQTQADVLRGPAPLLVAHHEGPAQLETHTVIFDRRGQPEFGTVIARTPEGARLMARVPADDLVTMACLTSLSNSPVGLQGTVEAGPEQRLHWGVAA